mmetsp:Transcript_20234/g.29714  ORF Transcript_20234/g.29714 Transcript_20234/m.29714 type:complete len:82 (+) Transcript_20234:115-360(+)
MLAISEPKITLMGEMSPSFLEKKDAKWGDFISSDDKSAFLGILTAHFDPRHPSTCLCARVRFKVVVRDLIEFSLGRLDLIF